MQSLIVRRSKFPIHNCEQNWAYKVTRGLTWSHWGVVEPPAQHPHGLHPVPLARSQCPGAQRSHDNPTTLGLQEHCPVAGSHGPPAGSVPSSLQLQA